jgi:hypothetical protein
MIVWSASLSDIPREKFTFHDIKILWGYGVGAISRKGCLALVFIDRGVKNNAEYYKKEVLLRILLPEAQKLYGDEYYCLPARRGAITHTKHHSQAMRI